jgi:hypothetical protein
MKIQEQLVKLAPSIEFSVAWSEDNDLGSLWDSEWGERGDKEPYTADVFARAIVQGKMLEGTASLGGCWETPGDFDEDINGYLPQMLEEATCDLLSAMADHGGDGAISMQVLEVLTFLKKEMKDRWEKEQKA